MGKATYPHVQLTKGVAGHLRRGHPFVFRDALRLPAGLSAGDVVDLVDDRGRFVARGTVEPSSPLAFRAWTLDPAQAVDQRLLAERLSAAAALRREVIGTDITAYRLCHGENDGVPGLQCDVYGSVASLRTDGELGLAWEQRFVDAVVAKLRPSAVVVRNPRRDEGHARVVHGREPDPLVIEERSRRLWVDVMRGQKTGMFLDQRDNRDRVGQLCGGAAVLNLFSYTGGFSVAAALAGATRVVSVDCAAPALATARENFQLNAIDPAPHGFEVADAFAVLEAAGCAGSHYDVVVVDPPAFAPRQQAVNKARKAYVRLNELALNVVARGGWLATASCSSHIRETDFLAIIAEAAERAGRSVRATGIFGAAADHPTLPGFPEGRYLKLVMLRVP